MSIGTLLKNLDRRARKWTDVEVEVAFTAEYALWVHERQAHHTVGQWKYLETAAVQNRKRAVEIFAETFAISGDPKISMMKAGLFIQAEAQKLTPIDTGNLRQSATTNLV